MEEHTLEGLSLTEEQKKLIARKREEAFERKRASEANRLASDIESKKKKVAKSKDEVNVNRSGRLIDTGGGFLLDVDDEDELTNKAEVAPTPNISSNDFLVTCKECELEFLDSFLLKHFEINVCNECRRKDDADDNSNAGKYDLLTKTDAKTEYCLKDSDVDVREPILKFLMKKNPHNERWGNMKLYVREQIEKRSLEVWGDWESLNDEKERRELKKEKTKEKKFDKKMRELRMTVRGSLFKKVSSAHDHEFGDEEYDEEEDMYSKQCKTCTHVLTYEKM